LSFLRLGFYAQSGTKHTPTLGFEIHLLGFDIQLHIFIILY
jgi:hypothetical protein